MNEAPGSYGRWRAADEAGRDDDADWAFQTVFQTSVAEAPVAPDFATRTMDAIAAAAARDVARTRRTRLAVAGAAVAASVAGLYFGASWAVSIVSAVFVGALNLLIAVAVSATGVVRGDTGVWALFGSLGRAMSALASDSNVTVAMIAISAVAIGALVALQRLLGSDEESFQ